MTHLICMFKAFTNTGVIITKLRHYYLSNILGRSTIILSILTFRMLLQPWAALAKEIFKKLQTKQNHVIRLMFFSTLSRKNTNSSLPLLNILEILTVTFVYRLHALKFIHAWYNGTLQELFNRFF